ncbi:MAG: Protein containing transglutaminase-like domain, putative cysteine protease [Acidobacteriaceae bacterium]|jgi:transglutaminase-like putative cysteine protease|nr:Protein containing transglutaminase-like domain, putative cysteine protease [Acidobacteriaceae bacterium]
MKYYSIQHLTRFDYSHTVCESGMEIRMQPRGDGNQRCLTFSLSVSPRCRVFSYRDHLGNQVHHFDIPGDHRQLVIVAHALVEQQPLGPVPDRLSPWSWDELDRLVAQDDFWEMLLPSTFAEPTAALRELAAEWKIVRRDDPLSLLHEISKNVYNSFEYLPRSTRVDSPIDVALETRRGVCQDFAHIMIALARKVGIPCRYVSGYLYHGDSEVDSILDGRGAPSATHAWVEAFLPQLGWVGFDPTNDLVVQDRHIRTALGRDYADVPPTHGLYRGKTESELSVAVHVEASDTAPSFDETMPVPEDWSIVVERAHDPLPLASPLLQIQQMQQQQGPQSIRASRR